MNRFKIFLLCCMLLTTLVRCFYTDWEKSIERWDEQTNLAVIQESLRSTLLPRLSYEEKLFFEKPPVWYLFNISILSLGVDSPLYLARGLSAVSGFLIICIVFLIALHWWGFIPASISWIVLITTNQLFVTNPNGIFSTHTFLSADSDALFILLLLISALFSFKLGESKLIAIAAGILTGMATLTKSPLGFIPLLCATYILSMKKNSIYHISDIFLAWGLAILLYGGWIGYMVVTSGSIFLTEFFGYHMLLRAAEPIENHKQSIFYFINLLRIKGLFLFFEIYVSTLILLLFSMDLQRDTRVFYVAIISLCFLLVPTIVQTKLAWYILPFYPFAALSIAGISHHILQRKIFRTANLLSMRASKKF